jgi:hypothetical protein
MSPKSISATLLVVSAFIFLPSVVNAQPGPPGPQPVPFDAGLTVIIAAAAGYAAKKKYNQRKNQQKKQDLDK